MSDDKDVFMTVDQMFREYCLSFGRQPVRVYLGRKERRKLLSYCIGVTQFAGEPDEPTRLLGLAVVKVDEDTFVAVGP